MRNRAHKVGYILNVLSDIYETSCLCQKWRDRGESIALVPTMGCLHAGHLSLVKKAQTLADHVVVSIFVNPLQFNDVEDLLNYPRTLEEDIAKLSDFSLDLVFAPEANAFYPEGKNEVAKIELGKITSILEGAQRPGHFAGVATVVKRLFGITLANVAVFGEKDFQQLMVIRQLVAKCSLDIKIIGMPTYRELDGLAMSSRNSRLTENERHKAPQIFQQLEFIKAAIVAGSTDFAGLERTASDRLLKAGFTPEYIAIRKAGTLLTPKNNEVELVVLAAAKLGQTRLIDNLRL